PPAGTSLLPGASVTLVVSVGAPTIPVPNLAGLTPFEADSALAQVGLRLGTSVRRTMPTAMPGTIIDQDPAPGTLGAPGTPINVTLARGDTP
ncbi:MAG: PASTA domain-containing protein, partial [Gemmatimonadota bacterium]|nr:PASTA domain-containing protein [Gemmatimonadota bacterium]